MGMPVDWFDLALGAGLVVSIALIVYVWLKNRELAKTILEEKVSVLGYAIPILKEIKDVLPPDKRSKVEMLITGLEAMKEINEALLQVSPAKLYKSWRAAKLKLKQ